MSISFFGGKRGLLERATVAQIDRYTTTWRKLLDIKGQPPGAMPGIELESDRPEWSFLKGENLVVARVAIAPAATVWAVGIQNPIGSGVIFTITKALLYTTVALVGSGAPNTSVVIADQQATGTTSVASPRDTRWFRGVISAGGRNNPLEGRALTTGFLGTNYPLERVPDLAVGQQYEAKLLPVILDEGKIYGFNSTITTTAPNTVAGEFIGYVRARNPGELTPG